jgi:hypothetical protein
MALAERHPEALQGLVRPTTLARERTLPVLDALAPVVPGGALRRGSTVAVGASPGGATSLALALAAGPSAAGSWTGAVGVPTLGLAAAAELGVALSRLVMVAGPGPAEAATVVATLVDAVDVVLVGDGCRIRPADERRLIARVRERGAVLLWVGRRAPGQGADLRLDVVAGRWEGVGDGHGHLRRRRVTVEAGGRREAARPRRVDLWLPAAAGGVEEVVDEAPVRPLRPVARLA